MGESPIYAFICVFFVSLCAAYFDFSSDQIGLVLASWDTPNQLDSAFSWLVDYFKDCVGYLSFSTNEKPFPFNKAE